MLNLHSGKKFLAPYLVVLMLGQANLSAFAQSTTEPAVNSGGAEPVEKIAGSQVSADAEGVAAVEPVLAAADSVALSAAPTNQSSAAEAAANPLTLSAPTDQSSAAEVSSGPGNDGNDTPLVAPLRLSGGASVSPAESEARIENLTKQILLKTIELEKFNLHYSQQVAKQGRWKGWRYAFFGEANAGMGLAGAIISTGYRGARIHHAAKVKPALQENANFIPMIGSIIGAGAAAMEFGINEYHDLQAGHKGFSPKASIRHVQALRDDLEKLSAEREAMIAEERKDPSLAGHVAINEAEGRVLKDLRDQSLQEFQRFHMGARRTFAFQQAQYFFDMAKNTTNAIGYEFAYLSLHRHHRIWNGRAGALWDVSGPLFMFGPILSRAVGKGAGELARYRSRNIVKGTDADIKNLEADLATLNGLVEKNRSNPDPVLKAVERTGMYDVHQQNFTKEILASRKSSNSAKLIATQNIGAGMYVGGTKLAQGILFSIAGFNHHYNNTSARASRVTNDLLFTGSVISIPSGMFTILDTLRIQVKGELNRHRLAQKGALPGQLVANRLKQLDELEAKLK